MSCAAHMQENKLKVYSKNIFMCHQMIRTRQQEIGTNDYIYDMKGAPPPTAGGGNDDYMT